MSDKRISVKKHEAILAAQEAENIERVRLMRVEIQGYQGQLLALVGRCESTDGEYRCTFYKGHDTRQYPHQQCVHLDGGWMTVETWGEGT